MNNHGLRTTGTHTGNFGRPKVQGKPGSLDLGETTLKRENLRIPGRDEAFQKLEEAFHKSSDPKQRAALWEILKRRKATLNPTVIKNNGRPNSEYWEMVRAVR